MKRLLGFILTLVMVFSLFPAALAAEAEEPAEEIFAEETTVEEVPTEEPVEDNALGVPGTPAEEAPADGNPVEEVPVEETPAEEAPSEEAPAEEVPVEEIPVEEIPVEEVPVEEIPVEEVPVEEIPVEEVPVTSVPAEEAPVEDSVEPFAEEKADSVAISAANFPDAKFRAWISEKADTNGDGVLSASEIGAVREITLLNMGITNLAGLRYFTALELLQCPNNALTSLDVSQNAALGLLTVDGNRLTSLDVSKNPNLYSLSCADNQLTTLDCSKNPALRYMTCGNNQLTSLNVRSNTELTTLTCQNNHLAYVELPSSNISGSFSGQVVYASLTPVSGGYALDLGALVGLSNVSSLIFKTLPDGASLNQKTGIMTLPGPQPALYYSVPGNVEVDLELTGQPTGPVITAISVAPEGVQLRWDPYPGAAKYAIYRKVGTESRFTRYTVTAAVKYTDKKATFLAYNYYRIWALDAAGKTLGTWSDEANIYFNPNVQPTINYVGNVRDGIQINWSTIPIAAKYAIYRRSSKEQVNTRYTVTAACTYTDRKVENGIAYTYQILALDANGKALGRMSNADGMLCKRAPNIGSIRNTASGITIGWTSSIYGTAKYAVYRKAAGESKYTRYTITTATSYTDKKAQEGVYYYYRVWALDANGKTIGEWSNARAITRTAS